MKSNSSWRIRLAQILLGAGFILALVVVRGTHAGNEPIHLATDWSHRRVVFSAPHNLGQHVKLLSNPRYVQQLVRKNGKPNGDPNGWKWRRAPEPTPGPTNPIHGDWNPYIGSGGTVGAGAFPAKFSFDVNSASCDTDNSSPNTNNNEDFVVYNTGLVPNATGTFASRTQTFTALTATNGQTLTITNNKLPAPNTMVLYANTGSLTTASGTISSAGGAPGNGNTVVVGAVTYTFSAAAPGAGTTQVLIGANSTTAAQNLRAAIDDSTVECATVGCFGTGITVANPAVTHPATYNGTTLITVTAASDGAAGNFTLTKANGGNPIVVAGGNQGAGANDGLNFQVAVSTTIEASNLAAAIVRNGGNTSPAIGVTATSSTNTVIISSANTGTGGTGAAFNVDISVVGPVTGMTIVTPLTGGGAGASIIAYSNVCPGGTGLVPWTYWSYNTGGQVVTSPILSGDGNQVAFVQNVGATGQLVLLKWAQWNGVGQPPTIDAPVTLTTQASALAYTTCTAPCMLTIPFSAGGTITDTNSDPFYDYANDTIYVGDDGAHLRKFTGVFKGTATQVGGNFPVAIANGGVLTSPVFDDGSGYVFVASSSGRLTRVLASTGATTFQSNQIGFTNGINDSPVLDPTNENVYVIVSDDAFLAAGNTGIFRFAAAFANATSGTETTVSGSNPGTAIYDGDFDNAWYSGGAGHMYVCGPAAATNTSTLYQIAVSATGVLSTVVTGPALSTSANLNCSGVTEFFNPSIGAGTDLIFLSVTGSAVTASPISCPSATTGCLMSFDVTSSAGFNATKVTKAQAAVSGGASGVIVDNDVSTATTGAGAGSQVYFTPLGYGYCTTPTTSNSGIGIGGCAIQASQSLLQ